MLDTMASEPLRQDITEDSPDYDVIASAKNDIAQWEGYWSDNVQQGHDDLSFLMYRQWTSAEETELSRLFKPALTFNKCYDAVRKVIGEQRGNTPDLKVISKTGKATQQDIKLRMDLLKAISYQSHADIVYQTAFKNALTFGYGAVLMKTEYESNKSFNQIISMEPIEDVERCFWDSNASAKDKSKCMGDYCGYVRTITTAEYRKKYSQFPLPANFDINPLLGLIWYSEDTVVVCDYWRREYFEIDVYRLDNGEDITKEEYDDFKKEYKETIKKMELLKLDALDNGVDTTLTQDPQIPPMPEIVMKRKDTDYKIMHYRMTSNAVIERTEWPSKYLPLVFCDGDSFRMDGRQYTLTFIRYAIDSQRFLNYLGSDIAAQVKNSRREQWLVTPDNIKGVERMWRNPEVQQGALIAKPDPKTGMPTKQPPSELPQTLLVQFQRATDDIKQILGLADPIQGAPSQILSGRAQDRKKMESNSSTKIYFDNLDQCVEQVGRVILDLMPKIYDTQRDVVLSNPDGSERKVTLNQDTPNGLQNEITEGDYDVCIEAGPSYAVQREQAVEVLMSLVGANPQTAPLVMDIVAKNIDIEAQPQLVERLKTLVPPDVLAKEEGKQPPPPQPNPAMMQMQMEMQQMQAQIQDMQQRLMLQKQKQDQDFEIKKGDLMLKAQDLSMKYADASIRGQAEVDKAHFDFAADIAKMLHDGQNKEADRAQALAFKNIDTENARQQQKSSE